MVASALLELLLLLWWSGAARAIAGGWEAVGPRDVSKCCERGFQLHAVDARCVPRPGAAAVSATTAAEKWELLRPPMRDADAYWLPPALRQAPVFASYDALDTAHDPQKRPSLRLQKLGYSRRVEAKPEIVQRFLKVNSTARRFELSAFKGRVALRTVRRQTFCFDATQSPQVPHVIFTTLELRSVPKCCAKGYQLNAKAEACERREQREKNENATEEIIDPFEYPKAAHWLPRKMLNTVIVAVYRNPQQPLLRWNIAVDAKSVVGLDAEDYDEDDDDEDDEAAKPKAGAAGREDRSKAQWELREDGAGYSVRVRGPSRTGSAVEGVAQEFCFDTTADGELPRRMVLARLWALPKCCARGQRLNANATGCEWPAEGDAGGEDGEGGFEDLSAVVASGNHHWVPQRLHSMKDLLVEYLREPDRQWISGRQEIRADDLNRWQLDRSGDVPRVTILSADAANRTVRSRAWVYCFDSKGAGGERVLLTVVSQVNKCCRKDEMLDVRAAKCVDRLGVEDGGDEMGIVDTQDPEAAFWIPAQLRSNLIPVRYEYGLMEKGGVVFEAEHVGRWSIEFRAEGSVLSLSSTTLSGSSRTVSTDKFCFDAVEKEGPLALIADVCYVQGFNCFFKCCPSGKLLSADGTCTDNSGRDWSPRASVAGPFLSSEGLYTAKILAHPICGNASFHADRTPATPREFAERLQGKERQYRFSKTFFCADFREGGGAGGGGDVAREALAYCVAPPIAPTYEAVRPLGVVAVALLAAALALLLRAPDTRATTHGRALACHAACLLAANATQAAWFFLDRDDAYCTYYAYAIYFFLVAAGTWLNAISINLARGFKRPLGALAVGARRKSGGAGGAAGGEWRRFALLSAWAWGVAAALTAVCVAAHGSAERLSDAGLYAPSLFETRTCFFEVVYTEHLRHGKVNKKDDLGAVVYFYGPMGVLVVVNAACLAFTMWNVRSLQRDASHVQRTGTSTAPATRSAVLYVKLLLTAGVVELGVEGLAWGARKRRFHGSSEWAEEFAAQSAFVFAIVGTCLDVARAAAVLWLCVGRCSCAGVPGAQAVGAAFHWMRRGVSGLSLRRFSQPVTASTSLPVPLEVLDDPSSSSTSAATKNSSNSNRICDTSLGGSTQELLEP